MKYRPLPNTNMNISVIALGTWVLGGGSFWGSAPNEGESIKTIKVSIDEGVNFIDTAPVYGYGKSEEVIGKAIQGKRDQVYIATKCGLWWDDERGSYFTKLDNRDIRRSLRPDTIQIEIENSLKRLKTDYIDLYQTHWQSVEPDFTAIETTMEELLKLKEAGKIRYIGCSNINLDQLKTYSQYDDFVSCQERYSMLYRSLEKEIIPFCSENNIGILAYSPLEQGLLSGKITMDTHFSDETWKQKKGWLPWLEKVHRKKVLDILEGWQEFIDKYNCTLAQLVIAWTINQKGITSALCGARTPAQTLENIKSAQINIEENDIEKMNRDLSSLKIS